VIKNILKIPMALQQHFLLDADRITKALNKDYIPVTHISLV